MAYVCCQAFVLCGGIKLKDMEEKLIEALQDLVNVKSEILGHLDFCIEGLSEDYEWLFDNAENAIKEAKANEA